MLAEQPLRGDVHRVRIEMARHAPASLDIEREVGAVVGDAIAVMPLLAEKRARNHPATISAESTPIGCGRRCAFSPSRRRPGGNGFSISQCATCAQRMHAGIGAARAVDANLLAADRLHRGFQRALHRRSVVLDLPAGERRAVIFDDELVAGHQPSRAGGLSGVPRRKSADFIGALPARCSSRMRIAPSPQAIVEAIVEHLARRAGTLRRFAARES